MKLSFKSNKKNRFKISIYANLYDVKINTSYKSYKYNNEIIFYYYIKFLKEALYLEIKPTKELSHFKTSCIGSFIYDLSLKYESNNTEIKFEKKLEKLSPLIHLGFMRKDYIYRKYLNKSEFHKFISSSKLESKSKSLLESINFVKELVSLPSNILYPKSYCELIKKNNKNKKLNLKFLNKKDIEKIGLNCLLSVAQGSQREPKVVTFNSKNKISKNKEYDVLFVGKGVCFDSGGISIKPSANMEDMKWDMAGSAVVCGVMKYLSEIKTNFSYAGIIGLVENMPSHTAYKPGDIIKSYKGINVEVLNTDAEGRLVLADIITYGCEIFKPKIVIDFATLTGAIMVALGQHYAGLFSNDDGLAQSLYKSGINTNEKVWRMPLHGDFDKELNSPFVDLKNIGAGRYGGATTAAQFLQRFVPKKTKWAHLDIAGTTWKNSGDIMNNKGATGFGLTLIADFIDKYFKN